MTALFSRRVQCEFDESALFFDLGHGMGRPSFHAAALHPHIAASFGTEFNPQLYKQSMLVLTDVCRRLPCFRVRWWPHRAVFLVVFFFLLAG